MKASIAITILLVLVVMSTMATGESKHTAAQILTRADSVANAPRDQTMNMRLVLIDEAGNARERELIMYQKGSDKRMGKFLSPADQAGIAFLSLPEGVMYVYLPAFKKTRRIASHVKNTKFAGTDFTYEDMEAGKYSDKYNPEILRREDGNHVLKLVPKAETESEYSRLILWIDEENSVPTKIEYYDKGDNLCKIMTRDDVVETDGYWFARQMEMSDLRSGQKTKMILQKVQFDQGLSNDMFTERYLIR